MMERRQISTGTPWETIAGFSRAVRVEAFVYVAGTTASDAAGQIQCLGELYGQAVYIFKKVEVDAVVAETAD